ncbi:MAG TPA: hypothetical protein VEP30_05130 [Chthoniobacterales bacterium]|nr:hypothetical protein [Chthoniobacterales bacterium]
MINSLTAPQRKMSWDTVYSLSQIVAVCFAGVALVSGLVVNKRQAKELVQLKIDLADAKTKQADAEKSLRELSDFATEQRSVSFDKAKEILQKGPKGSVEIVPLEGSVESNFLAEQLQLIFNKNGWKVSMRKAGTDEIINAGIAVVTGSRSDGSFDKDWVLQLDEPANTLRTLLTTCVSGNARGGSFRTDSRMAKDTSVVLIGPKY